MPARSRQVFGFPLYSSDAMPDDQVVVALDGAHTVLYVSDLTRWSLDHDGRWPLLSCYTAGERERRRDRRHR